MKAQAAATPTMLTAVARSQSFSEFARYFLASVVALGADLGLLLILSGLMHYAVAASLSFLVGCVVHYLLAVVLVFRRRRLAHRRSAEAAIFIVIGVLALPVNVGVIAIAVEFLGSPLAAAKLAAAGCSFVFAFAVRKLALF